MKIMKWLLGLLLIVTMLPVIIIMGIVGGGISGLYYLVFMLLYKILDVINRQKNMLITFQK